MKTLIVDDEPLARSRLKRLLAAHPDYICVGEASNGEEAITKTATLNPDLVLLDIEMPGGDGLYVAEQLNALHIPPAIVFVTAHPEHALDAYRVSPADYLLKPVDPKRLAETLQRLGTHTRAHLEKHEELNPWVSYQIGNSLRRIRFDQINFFMAEDKYVKVVFEGGEAFLNNSLKELEKQYNSGVTRVHRNLLVNTNKIEAVHCSANTYYIKLVGISDALPVSRRKVLELKSLLKKDHLSTGNNHSSD